MNYGYRFVTLYRKQGSRWSPRKRDAKTQNGSWRRPYKQLEKKRSEKQRRKGSSVQFSRSVMSDSLRPHESQHARPPCPSPTPRVHSNTSIKSVIPSNHLILCRPLLLRWISSTLATSCEEMTHWKSLCCWEGLGAGGEGDDPGWDAWMASLTRWTWVWVNSGRWCWRGRPGMLWFMGSQRVGHDWATELNWTDTVLMFFFLGYFTLYNWLQFHPPH